MAVRKQRSKQFLSNPFAAFNIIFTLVFHYLLTHVTAAAFALMDSDRDDIMEKKPTHRQEIKERKRLRYKGAQCFEDPEHQPQGSGMADLFLKASQVVNVLWTVLTSPGALTESIFSVPGTFWPEGHGRHQLLERLVDDILKTLCGLKWRILYRKEAPPLQYLHLQSPDFDPAEATAQLLATQSCCLDPFWSRAIQAELQEVNDSDEQASRFQRHVHTLATNLRAVSSREENLHAQQRVAAGGWKAKATLFSKQAAESILRCSLDNFISRTGVLPDKAPKAVQAASKVARKRKWIHKRPRQYGNPMFQYINARKKEPDCTNTFQELRAEWASLNVEAKSRWKNQHIAKVAAHRLAHQHMAQVAKDRSVKASPWRLGDDRHPITKEALSGFLSVFKQRGTGLEALGKCKCEEARDLLKNYLEKGRKYHSADTATAAAKEMLGNIIDYDSACKDNWGEVMGCQRQKPSCFEKHPGLCETKDANIISKVETFTRMLPKGNSILMFELGERPRKDRLAVFARVVTGLCFSKRLKM